MAVPAFAVLVARYVASGYSRVMATRKAQSILKNMKRADKDQPKTGQKEMWKGEAGPNVKRPTGPGKNEHYELDKGPAQGDLFIKPKTTMKIVKD